MTATNDLVGIIWKGRPIFISADIFFVEMNWPIALPGQLSTEGATKTSYHKTPFNSITNNYGSPGKFFAM